jgi:hypothetical protein
VLRLKCEQLEDRTLFNIDLTFTAGATARVVDSGSHTQVFIDGGLQYDGASADINSITFNGAAGGTTLTVDESGGTIAPAVIFNGVAGAPNDFKLTGGGSAGRFDSEAYTMAGPRAGAIQLSNGAGVIRFANLGDPLDTTPAASVTYTDTSVASDSVLIHNGPAVAPGGTPDCLFGCNTTEIQAANGSI